MLRLVSVIAILAVASTCAYLVLLQRTGDRLAVRRMTSVWSREDVESAYSQDRVEKVYVQYLSVIWKNPVFGSGKSITGTGELPIEGHNQYIRVLAETGLIGLVLYLAIVGLIMRYSYVALCAAPQGWPRTFAQAGFLFGIFMNVAALGQDTFATILTAELYWLLAAIEVRLYLQAKLKSTHWAPV